PGRATHRENRSTTRGWRRRTRRACWRRWADRRSPRRCSATTWRPARRRTPTERSTWSTIARGWSAKWAAARENAMATDLRKLRPSELCRLLNSTPLGEVINERQLYWHRTRAGMRIGDGRFVDLLRYVAWLVEVRHAPKPEPEG